MAVPPHIRLQRDEGFAVVADRRVRVRPVGTSGALAVAGTVVRPLAFGERTRIVAEAAGLPDPATAVAGSVARAAAGTDRDALVTALALHLAGAGDEGPSFVAALVAVATHMGWGPRDIEPVAATEVDRLAGLLGAAGGTPEPEDGWHRVVFAATPAADDDDVAVVVRSLAGDLLRRVAAPLVRAAATAPADPDPTRGRSRSQAAVPHGSGGGQAGGQLLRTARLPSLSVADGGERVLPARPNPPAPVRAAAWAQSPEAPDGALPPAATPAPVAPNGSLPPVSAVRPVGVVPTPSAALGVEPGPSPTPGVADAGSATPAARPTSPPTAAADGAITAPPRSRWARTPDAAPWWCDAEAGHDGPQRGAGRQWPAADPHAGLRAGPATADAAVADGGFRLGTAPTATVAADVASALAAQLESECDLRGLAR